MSLHKIRVQKVSLFLVKTRGPSGPEALTWVLFKAYIKVFVES